MSVFALRHAEKERGEFYSPGLRFNDQPITASGRKQAKRLADFFSTVDIASVWVSEYRRTAETADPLCKRKGLSPRVDARLNEIDVGVTERMPDDEVKAAYPDFWRAYIDRNADFRIPGGETGEEAAARAMAVFGSLDRSRNHVIVSHEGLIRVLACSVLGLPPYKRHLFTVDFASITVFEYSMDFGCWRVPRLNMTV